MGQYAKHRHLVGIRIIAATAMVLLAAPASACRLALVLALDVSSSVDATEDRLQRAGLAAALIDPDVLAAIVNDPTPVALAVFEWSGRFAQAEVLDWTLLNTPVDVIAAAEKLSLIHI